MDTPWRCSDAAAAAWGLLSRRPLRLLVTRIQVLFCLQHKLQCVQHHSQPLDTDQPTSALHDVCQHCSVCGCLVWCGELRVPRLSQAANIHRQYNTQTYRTLTQCEILTRSLNQNLPTYMLHRYKTIPSRNFKTKFTLLQRRFQAIYAANFVTIFGLQQTSVVCCCSWWRTFLNTVFTQMLS